MRACSITALLCLIQRTNFGNAKMEIAMLRSLHSDGTLTDEDEQHVNDEAGRNSNRYLPIKGPNTAGVRIANLVQKAVGTTVTRSEDAAGALYRRTEAERRKLK